MGRQFNIEEEDINFRRMVENIYGFIYQSEKESEREREIKLYNTHRGFRK